MYHYFRKNRQASGGGHDPLLIEMARGEYSAERRLGRSVLAFIVSLAMLAALVGGYGGAGSAAAYAASVYDVKTLGELEAALGQAGPGDIVAIKGDIADVTSGALTLAEGAILKVASGGKLALTKGAVVAGGFDIYGDVEIESGGEIDWSGVASSAGGTVEVESAASITLNGGTFKLPPEAANSYPVYPFTGALLAYKGGTTENVFVRVDQADNGNRYENLSDTKAGKTYVRVENTVDVSDYGSIDGPAAWVEPAVFQGGVLVSEVNAPYGGDGSSNEYRLDKALEDVIDHIEAGKVYYGSAAMGEGVVAVKKLVGGAKDVLFRIDANTGGLFGLVSSGMERLRLESPVGDIEVTAAAINKLASVPSGSAEVWIAPGALSAAQKTIYSRAAEVAMKSNGTPLADLASASATVTLPYDYGDERNRASVKLFLLRASGPERVEGIDVKEGKTSFLTKSFGTFAFEQTYTVTFDSADGSAVNLQSGIAHGTSAQAVTQGVAAPTRTGYSFSGWTWADGTAIQPSEVITGDASFKAAWTANKCNVTFQDGSTVIQVSSLDYGSKLGTLPVPQSKAGHRFAGWYTAASGGSQISADTVVQGDTTYYARWTTNRYKVTFKDGSKIVKTYTKAYDTKFSKFPKAKKKGYRFKGWYTKKKGGTLVKKVVVRKNVAYYAHWVRVVTIKNAYVVRMHSKARNSSRVVAYAKKGKTLEYLGKKGSWYKVRYGKKTGYIYKKFIKL